MDNISKAMEILGKRYPRATTTLNTMRGSATPFEILISCLLSLRARDEVTDVVSKNLFAVADSPEKIVKLIFIAYINSLIVLKKI